jgi:hypothetical protein
MPSGSKRRTSASTASTWKLWTGLNSLGAVVTCTARGVSHEDFDAEWRMIDIFTVDGDLINRCEIFDETDLDAALARFDELDRPAPP